jgi:acetyl-CoA decarbonylase/synthase complex subunit delta
LALEIPIKKFMGTINTVELGKTLTQGGTRGFNLLTGGSNTLPLHTFEGNCPYNPITALEILDIYPSDWENDLKEQYSDVMDDPVAWAQKAVEVYGVKLISVYLLGTHPDKGNISPEKAASNIQNILKKVKVPLIIRGAGSAKKQNEVLSLCAEAAKGEGCALVSATSDEYKTLVAAATAYGHVVVAESPIDINLAKQLNILLTDLGFSADRILMDPLTGGLGYGLEYTYSVIERIRLQALSGDRMLQMPVICFLGEEAWKAKEIKMTDSPFNLPGSKKPRGILWEAASALALIYAGADIVVLRHPDSMKVINEFTEEIMFNTKK